MKTTFNPKKQNAVQYPLGENGQHGKTMVIFETRHNIGHEVVSYLSEKGIDVNDFVDKHGNPDEKLQFAIHNMVLELKKSLPKKKVKTVRKKEQKASSPRLEADGIARTVKQQKTRGGGNGH